MTQENESEDSKLQQTLSLCADLHGGTGAYWGRMRDAVGTLTGAERVHVVSLWAMRNDALEGAQSVIEYMEAEHAWACDDCGCETGEPMAGQLRNLGGLYCRRCIGLADTDVREFEHSHRAGVV